MIATGKKKNLDFKNYLLRYRMIQTFLLLGRITVFRGYDDDDNNKKNLRTAFTALYT